MRATLSLLRSVRNARTMVEHPSVPVPVPTGPKADKSFMVVSSRDPEIYPLVFCVSVGFAIGAYSLVHHVLSNPDINLTHDRRETPTWERYKAEEGESFTQNRHHLANLKPNPINTFSEAKRTHE
ncbi:uncharacterized protein CCR75_007822 [Bremia lactucae]|uniref:NADH dehydrogenase [ubiquinone] 1 alpha subcomplex subunit 4 n=1 Tax=Bremia lactucae TaxID=4779 RepID=A0A976ILV2_BRELC|nr:hypothetical protein CCR75_007822 [Bremia lactucae]